MTPDPQAPLRDHLAELLDGGHAHATFDLAADGLPVALRRARIAGYGQTPWRLVEHLRIAQWDILRFCLDPAHVSPTFPDGYWPAGDAPPDDLAWDATLAGFRADLASIRRLVMDPSTDLFAPLPHGTGQTPLREALLVADHNAYHVGQLVALRRALGAWAGE